MTIRRRFARTTCACRQCVACCTKQPGPLAPGDFEAIREYLGQTEPEARAQFVASPGALVMDRATGHQFRIGTITPKLVRGRCVFLDAADRCRIHAVAPFGCAYFDTHMSAAHAQPRGIALAEATQDAAYQQLRGTLPFTSSYKPTGY